MEQRCAVENQLVPQQDASELLTMDDVDEGAPVEYDALVLFAEADQEFVDVMISNMTKIGFRLLTKHNLRPGIMPYRPMTELMNSRCRHTILVYSPAFLESPDDNFYTDYVHARDVETKNHILITCLYKQCQLPTQYQHYVTLCVNSSKYDFWDRLARVVDFGRPSRLTTPTSTSSVRIQEVTSSGPLKIVNGQVPNGHASQSDPNSQSVQSGQTLSTHLSQNSTQTITLPEVPSATLSLPMTTLSSNVDSGRMETTSLNDISVIKKSFSFINKSFEWAKKNKTKAIASFKLTS